MKEKGKSDPELMELRKVPFEENKKNYITKNYQIIIIILLVICLCVILGISFCVYQKVSQDFKLQIQQKDNEIEKMQEQLNNLKAQKAEQNKRLAEIKEEPKKKLTYLEQQYLYDTNFYIKNNMHSAEDLNRLSYELVIITHTLEKGMSHFDLRPFAQEKTKSIMNMLKKAMKYDGYKKKFWVFTFYKWIKRI